MRHKNANFQIVASHIKEDSSSPGCSHQRSLWMVGVDQRNQDFYIASESGNSYYGLPPPNNEVDENFGLLISGQQLPMGKNLLACT